MSDLVKYTDNAEEETAEVKPTIYAIDQIDLHEAVIADKGVAVFDKNAISDIEASLPQYPRVEEHQNHFLGSRTSSMFGASSVVSAVGVDDFLEEANIMAPADTDPGPELLPTAPLPGLVDGSRSSVIEAGIDVACKIGRAAERGKRVGAIFMIGDSQRVLEYSHQLIPNPFEGHGSEVRSLTNPANHDTLLELAKLDGAFVVRDDGFIQAAAVFLMPDKNELRIPAGLGARHVSAAAMTARTSATAIVVSATDGNIRVFSNGKLVCHLDPTIHHFPISLLNGGANSLDTNT